LYGSARLKRTVSVARTGAAAGSARSTHSAPSPYLTSHSTHPVSAAPPSWNSPIGTEKSGSVLAPRWMRCAAQRTREGVGRPGTHASVANMSSTAKAPPPRSVEGAGPLAPKAGLACTRMARSLDCVPA